MRLTVGRLLKNAKLDVFFSNHSLRHSGTTHLFQAGIDRKIVKEYTGHRSDAVDQYHITSDQQHPHLSSILQGKGKQGTVSRPESDVQITVLQWKRSWVYK